MKARQSKGFNFEGQDLFIGIDVHFRTWNVSILTASGFVERYSQPASAEKLFEHLVKKYPSATYHAVYESVFSGFSTYYALTKYGISCAIAHAADVPTTQRENIMKSDPIDSLKLAKALKSGLKQHLYSQ